MCVNDNPIMKEDALMNETAALRPQVERLSTVMDALLEQETINTNEEAFDAMIDVIAYKLSYQTMIQTPWLKQEIADKVDELLDLDFLREDRWDWLGEVYDLRVSHAPYFVERSIVESYALKHKPIGVEDTNLFTLRDNVAGSGRLILAYSSLINKDKSVIYYGMEPNLLAYRIAVLNFKLHGLNFRILCANHNDIDGRPQSPNWKYSNMWSPVERKKFFTTEEVDNLGHGINQDPPAVYYYI